MTDRQIAVPARPRPRVLPAVPDLRRLRAAEDRAEPERPTIAEIVERCLQWKTHVASKDTIRTYRDGLARFAELLAISGIDTFTEGRRAASDDL